MHSSSTLTDHEFTSFSYSLASLTPTNIIDQHNSSVAIYSAVIGVVVFMVLVITVAMVLLLFCIRKQRLKKNYDLQNPTTDTSIVNPMSESMNCIVNLNTESCIHYNAMIVFLQSIQTSMMSVLNNK